MPACALRFNFSFKNCKIKTRKNFNSGLIILGGIPERAIKLIDYIYNQISSEDLNIIIRPHPALPFSEIIKEYPDFSLPEKWTISQNLEPGKDFEECDFILYDASTLCLNALLYGLPAIHINLGDIFNYDPLFQLQEFKWEISVHENLWDLLKNIKELEDAEYYIKQNLGRQYAESYLLPVNDTNLRKFLRYEDYYEN